MAQADRLGRELLEKKLITEEDLYKALEQHDLTQKPIGKILVDMGVIEEDTLVAILAAQAGFAFVDLTKETINSTAIALVTEDDARKFNVIPIEIQDDHLEVAMANPSDLMVIEDLEHKTEMKIKPVVATKTDIINAINYYYALDLDLEEEEELDYDIDDDKNYEDTPIIKLANLIVVKAVEQKSSDIHIEPQKRDLRIRYRVDGVLHEVMVLPKKLQPALLSRFKIMSSLDISETRKPQDGHMSLMIARRGVDFRVATLPTVYGERIVLRVLEKQSIMLKLDDLGFSSDDLKKFHSVFSRPQGTILVTGPTGSGKSTTLYATLNILNTPVKNIVTIEDPVEYRLNGLNQIQINPKAGLTFASGLRSILRASPDVVMVGEIRDGETAQIAIEAALTGHLVFSTLHTNDAPGAFSRLIEMGINPFLISSSITCVQAQRLARRLCVTCKEEYTPDFEMLKTLGFPLTKEDEGNLKLYKSKGCSDCAQTGYKGRMGLYEVLLSNEEIQDLVIKKASADEIKRAALKAGMTTLRQDGFNKVRQGLTSIEEVLRVVV